MTVGVSAPSGVGSGLCCRVVSTGVTGPLVFPVHIALDQLSIEVEGKDVVLTPGMSVTAKVKTGNRQVLEFLLDPLMEMRG